MTEHDRPRELRAQIEAELTALAAMPPPATPPPVAEPDQPWQDDPVLAPHPPRPATDLPPAEYAAAMEAFRQAKIAFFEHLPVREPLVPLDENEAARWEAWHTAGDLLAELSELDPAGFLALGRRWAHDRPARALPRAEQVERMAPALRAAGLLD